MPWTTAILDADRSAFLAINGAHSAAADTFFWYVSDARVWIPVYAFFFVLIKLRWGWRGLGWSLPVIALMILCSDTGSVLLFKNTVQRLRPSHAEDLNGLVHLVKDGNGEFYMGGLYGFVSSHAANHFAIASFMIGILQRRPKWSIAVLLLWAMLISYSRVYLGVHYPGDVIVGGIYGIGIGVLAYQGFLFLHERVAAT
jgi:undecaprenyl-diphosphatase